MSDTSSQFQITRADPKSVEDALPLLLIQMKEHNIEIDAPTLMTAIKGLVDVPSRGAVLLARTARSKEQHASVVGVAVLAYTWTIEHGGKCTWLDELYVIPEMRGSGIGTMLLHRAIDLARSEGCRAMDLEVDIDHARVESLYLREGFHTLPRRRFARVLTPLT
jgi:GNAT superfamily N-acetyltransferase